MNKFFIFLKKKELHIMFSLTIVAAVFGYYAYRFDNQSRSGSLYRTLQMYILNTQEVKTYSVSFEVARWLAALVFVYSIINLVSIFIKDQIDEFAIKYFYKNHIVICGLSWKAKELIKDIKLRKCKIVIIEKNKNHEDISEYKFCKNVKIIIGDAEDEEILNRASLHKASYIFAFTENDQTNLRITDYIQKTYENSGIKKSFNKRREPLKVRIHLKDYYNLMVFKEFHKGSDGKINYHAFNLYQQAAEKVIDEFSPDQFLPILVETSEQIHILVSGLTILGEYVIIEAAQMYHFANLKKLKISVIDSDIKNQLKRFSNKFPNIEKIVDLIPIDSIDFSHVGEIKSQMSDISVCFLCHNDDAESINKYMIYRQFFYEKTKAFDHPTIVAILPQNTSVKAILPNIKYNAEELKVTIKELYEDFCKKCVLIDNIEKYDNIAMNIDLIYEKDQAKIDIDIKNFRLKDWNQKTDFEKDWNRYPARHFYIKLRTAGIQLSEFINKNNKGINHIKLDDNTKQRLAKMEHRRWCAEKWLTGFVPGEYIQDKVYEKFLKRKLKYHPDLVDWNELPSKEQVKDFLTIDNLIYVAKLVLSAESRIEDLQ